MPLPIPSLDDRTFDQLVDEAKALIPKHFPTWTDHNFSDPGITFLDLFAFLIENAIYQINRVPDRSREHFASLLGVKRMSGESTEMLFRRVREKLDARERAVTEDEIEQQILAQPAERWPQKQEIARAEVIVDLHAASGVRHAELTLKIVIVPEASSENDVAPKPGDELRQAIFEFLSERVMIGTRLQVAPPDYHALFQLRATVVRSGQSRLDRATVRQNVVSAVRKFLHPTLGGKDGRGWPLGRSIFRSEIYRVIEGLPGVDHVRELLLLDTPDLHRRESARDIESSPGQIGTEPSRPAAPLFPLSAGQRHSPETVAELPLPGPTSLIQWTEETFEVTVRDE
jgi:hypothetical protein